MDGPALSGRERRLLDEIECDLRRDTRLDRRLSTMGAAERPRRLWNALRGLGHRLPTGVLMTALVMAAICLSIAVRRPTTVVAIATAAVWVGSVALAAGLSALLRRHRRHRAEPVDGLPDGGYREPGARRHPSFPADPDPGRHPGWGAYRDRDGEQGDGRADDQGDEPGGRGRRERRPWDHPEA
ncbi:DUF3040 domain-containing protein [Kitasatospora misakiensis]|uniref:DUF3040 domain-containing protein n=1 Tax=Kitasatospora misakiensis TaxID=67330 RepID=A0ABW0XBD4_9ACTN